MIKSGALGELAAMKHFLGLGYEVYTAIPFKVLPFSPVVLRDRQEKRDVVRGTGSD